MTQLRRAVLAGTLLAALAVPSANAAGPPASGFLPASAHPLGYSLTDLATAWTIYGWSTSVGNPLLDPPRCEQSPSDARIWFLPVSIGGDIQVTCDVPQGAFLVMFGGGVECSDAEGPPWHGGNEAQLRDCVDGDLGLITYQTISMDGVTSSDLAAYVVRTRMVTLPADNLLSADPTISMTKGYFSVIGPLSRGSHTAANYTEFGSVDFAGGVTYPINVH
jgi:hypothetical protein